MNTWLITMQDSNSPICDLMIFFHDSTMIMLTLITILIFYAMAFNMFNTLTNRFLSQNHSMEIIWTILPMLLLILIALPSIKILYLTDEPLHCKITIKTIGHQWYWSYEYSDFKHIEFDSFMIPTNQSSLSDFRLLEVDNRCILPFNFPIRILTSSMDVIHAWTVPSLGIKMDSTPGRLNQLSLYISRPGLFFGQCSEICGLNHSFMPICIETTSLYYFKNWLMTQYKIN